MNRAAEFRVVVDECATADMVADDMPTDDEELRMTGLSLDVDQENIIASAFVSPTLARTEPVLFFSTSSRQRLEARTQ